MVEPDAIGDIGRHVRCKKCAYVWFQDCENKVINELISRIQDSDIVVDDIDFGEMKKGAKPTEKLQHNQAFFKNIIDKFLKLHFFSMRREAFLKLCSSFMVALALISIIFYGFVSQRWAVVSQIPSLNVFYNSIGFPLEPFVEVNPEDFLIIENHNIHFKDGKKIVEANLINLSSNLIKLPRLKISYLDEDNKLILDDIRSFKFSVMPKEFSHNFYFSPPEKISNDFKFIQISFIE